MESNPPAPRVAAQPVRRPNNPRGASITKGKTGGIQNKTLESRDRRRYRISPTHTNIMYCFTIRNCRRLTPNNITYLLANKLAQKPNEFHSLSLGDHISTTSTTLIKQELQEPRARQNIPLREPILLIISLLPRGAYPRPVVFI